MTAQTQQGWTVRMWKRCSRISSLRSSMLIPTTANLGSQAKGTLFFKLSGVSAQAIAEQAGPHSERIALTRRECPRPRFVRVSYLRCWLPSGDAIFIHPIPAPMCRHWMAQVAGHA